MFCLVCPYCLGIGWIQVPQSLVLLVSWLAARRSERDEKHDPLGTGGLERGRVSWSIDQAVPFAKPTSAGTDAVFGGLTRIRFGFILKD